jgi:ribulose-phosphate 3-epimerase
MAQNTLKTLSSTDTILSPSILAADFTELGKEVTMATDAGIELLHIDVMDGHFVPNISIGIPIVKSLRSKSELIFDIHLMITNPIEYVEAFAQAGADHITFHVESNSPIKETIQAIKDLGLTVGLTLKPGTDAEILKPFIQEIDMVLVMTVEPGFGGQKFMTSMLEKISTIRKWADELNPNMHIEVDGGISSETAKLVKKAGANVLVAGTAFFRHPDGMEAAAQELRSHS